MQYKCGIVEVEPLAVDILKKYLKRFPFISISWECSYAIEAVEILKKKKTDLLIIDLQNLPIVKNSAFYNLIHSQKCIIITSAYPIQMVNIPLDVIGFLNKPFTFEQFRVAIEHFIAVSDD